MIKKDDIIVIKYSFEQIIKMYKKNELKFKSNLCATNDRDIYGIDWNTFKFLCNKKGRVIEICENDMWIDFENLLGYLYIPKELIQKLNDRISLYINDIHFEI